MAKTPTPEPVTKFCERCDDPNARGKWLGIARLTRIPDVGWPQRSECWKVVTAEEKAKGERIVAEYRAMEKQAEDNDVSLARLRISRGECGRSSGSAFASRFVVCRKRHSMRHNPDLTNCARKPSSLFVQFSKG